MRPMNMKNATSKTQLFLALIMAVTVMLAPAAFAAAPGITGTSTPGTATTATFSLDAHDSYLNQPDGSAVYSWGYGCVSGSTPDFVPKAPFAFKAACDLMQVPGPTMVVTEGATVTVTLTNSLPTAAGNTSILFPGFSVTTSGGVTGLLTQEAAPGGTVSYSFIASAPGTHAYYSGTQGDLQVEMGLYGAVIVLPKTIPANCTGGYHALNLMAEANTKESDFRLTNANGGSGAAYDHPGSCYDREYLFQWAEMDSRIHKQAEAQVLAKTGCTAGSMGCSLDVQTEPYHPAYFLINGRSMPDLMDPNYASEYPHQPYNGNPHMHPGELTLIRTIGQGRWQHPFHEHANHVRILARDGNLILSANTTPVTFGSGLSGDTGVSAPGLAGTLMFNTDTTPGESFDGIFYFTGRGLNWDPYGHHPAGTGNGVTKLPIAAISETGTTVTVTFNESQVPLIGGQVVVTGVTPAGYNGAFTVTGTSAGPSVSITSIKETGSTVTATVSGTLPTGFAAGAVCYRFGCSHRCLRWRLQDSHRHLGRDQYLHLYRNQHRSGRGDGTDHGNWLAQRFTDYLHKYRRPGRRNSNGRNGNREPRHRQSVERSSRFVAVHARRERVQLQRANRGQLHGVVPGSQQAGPGGSLRRCRRGRSSDVAGSERLHQRPMVWRLALPRSRRHPARISFRMRHHDGRQLH